MTHSLMQTLKGYKGVLFLAIAFGAAAIWILWVQQGQFSLSSISLGTDFQIWGASEPKSSDSSANSPNAIDALAKSNDLWVNPQNSSSPDVVAARYAWLWKTHTKLAVEAFSSYIRVPKICLEGGGADAKPRCFETALVTTMNTVPACFLRHINIRSTYLYNGQAVSIVEMSEALHAVRTKTLFCASGVPASVEFFTVSHWLRDSLPELTHTNVFVRCPARDLSDQNAAGLLLINHHGNCSLSPPLLASSASSGKRTTLVLLTTPVTNSFQQEFPSLPVRGNALLSLPNARSWPGAPFQFSICAMAGVMDTDAPFLSAWLWHLRNRVLVEHVVLYTAPDNFFLDSPNINAVLLKELLSIGFLTLVPWPSRFIDNVETFYRSQHTAYNDYAFRFRGMCHWTFFADADDFFVDWQNNHRMLPLITEQLKQNPNYDSINMAWPVFLPECQGLSGLGPPFESDSFLQQVRYGILPTPNHKHIAITYDKYDVGIHRTTGRKAAGPLLRAGVAVFHIRAGPFKKRGIFDFSETTCAQYYLKDFDLEARKKRVYD